MNRWEPPQKWSPDKLEKARVLTRRTRRIRHYLNDQQRRFYDLTHKEGVREAALYCSRKVGKSFISFLMDIEFAWNNPNTIVRYIAPTLKSAREVVIPIFNELKRILPLEMMPALKKAELKFVFDNGAEIHLGGASLENIEGSRGPICHKITLDETGAFPDGSDLDYVLYSVLYPQLTTTQGQIIHLTTPPKNINHKWLTHLYQKMRDAGNTVEFNIDQNPLLTPEQVLAIEELYGGRDSPDFQREYLLKSIQETSLRVCREYVDSTHSANTAEIMDKWTEETRDPISSYIVVDYGVTDLTAILLCVYHKYDDKMLVLKEWEVSDGAEAFAETLTAVIKDANNLRLNEPASIIIDCMEQTRTFLMAKPYEFVFSRPRKKRRKIDSVAFLRNKIETNKIVVDKSCKKLRSMLEYGCWKKSDSENKEFARSDTLGHLDHVDSLIYAALFVKWAASDKKNSLDLLGG